MFLRCSFPIINSKTLIVSVEMAPFASAQINHSGDLIAILSTNQGVITDKEARKLQVGGEVLAFVW